MSDERQRAAERRAALGDPDAERSAQREQSRSLSREREVAAQDVERENERWHRAGRWRALAVADAAGPGNAPTPGVEPSPADMATWSDASPLTLGEARAAWREGWDYGVLRLVSDPEFWDPAEAAQRRRDLARVAHMATLLPGVHVEVLAPSVHAGERGVVTEERDGGDGDGFPVRVDGLDMRIAPERLRVLGPGGVVPCDLPCDLWCEECGGAAVWSGHPEEAAFCPAHPEAGVS